MIVNLLNINYINQSNSQIEVIGEKVLTLKSNQKKVSLPHLNIKGTIKDINSNSIDIELSDYAKTFLENTQITIHNESFNLKENQRIFIKINDINIEEKNLYYSFVEIYKYIKELDIDNKKEDFFVCKSDYGGFMKVDGVSFEYNNNIYFKSDYELSKNNEIYFANIKNGFLLIEEIKSIIIPFKIYNMINPQETRFNEMIEIYTNNK